MKLKNIVRRSLGYLGYDVVRPSPAPSVPRLRDEFTGVRFAGVALQTLLDHYDFNSVLDIGSGAGEHANIFRRHGKKVTSVDFGSSIYFLQNPAQSNVIVGDFNEMTLDGVFDCVWASHVLEHQRDVNKFLTRISRATREGGIIALTVPPLKHEIVGGHVTLWNAGLLLYNLVLAGFDCREAAVLAYGYNITVIVRKKNIELPPLAMDRGDITILKQWLPEGCFEGFNGDMQSRNWPGAQ